MCGEGTLLSFKAMIRALPENHYLGLINVPIGCDAPHSNELVSFLTRYAKRKGFAVVITLGPRSARAIFDSFFEMLGDVDPAGTC